MPVLRVRIKYKISILTPYARECYHNDMYNSEYCDVSYDKARNVVFVKWKKYCHHESYRLEGQEKDSEGKINFKYIYGMSEITGT